MIKASLILCVVDSVKMVLPATVKNALSSSQYFVVLDSSMFLFPVAVQASVPSNSFLTWMIPTGLLGRSSGWCGRVLVALTVTAAAQCTHRGVSCKWWWGLLCSVLRCHSERGEPALGTLVRLWDWLVLVSPSKCDERLPKLLALWETGLLGSSRPLHGELSRSRETLQSPRQSLLLAYGGSLCSARSCWAHWGVCSWGRGPDEPRLVIPCPSSFLASGDSSSLLQAVTQSVPSVLLPPQWRSHSARNPSWMLPLLSWTRGWFNSLVWGDWFRFYCATAAEQKVFKMKRAHPFLPYSPVFTLISRSTTWCPDGFVSS